jgi:two-component system LytT family sensor kinase
LLPLVCGLVWACLQAYIIHSFGFVWVTAVTDSAMSAVLLSGACWLINNNLRYYQPDKESYVYLLIWCAALAAALYCRLPLHFAAI